MTDSLEIYRKADRLVQHFGTRNPEEIAAGLGIQIYDTLQTRNLLGIYLCKWRQRIIGLNQDLEEHMRLNIIAHELGHDQEHRELAKKGTLQEFTLFNIKDQTEYEANAFGSHILIDTKDVLEYARQGYDIVQTAKALNVHINMLLIKVGEMNKLGYSLYMPKEPDPTFLREVSPHYGKR